MVKNSTPVKGEVLMNAENVIEDTLSFVSAELAVGIVDMAWFGWKPHGPPNFVPVGHQCHNDRPF